MSPLAPIVLFVYNRPDHTRKTLRALADNLLAQESLLFIYADGAKENANDAVRQAIAATREVAKAEQWCKEVKIIESESNRGLASSIIAGVTATVNRFGKVIVLEDDIVTSPYFLTYMNDALNFYENEKKVWHIGAYSAPFENHALPDAFFIRYMECWGWGTWADRWQYFAKNPARLISEFSDEDIYQFNLDGAEPGQWGAVLANSRGEMNTWAVFWGATIFKQGGLCLNPAVSFINNIGFDGSGAHCGTSANFNHAILCEKRLDFAAIEITENAEAFARLRQFYWRMSSRPSLIKRIKRHVKQLLPASVVAIMRRWCDKIAGRNINYGGGGG